MFSYKEFLNGLVKWKEPDNVVLAEEIAALPEANTLLHGDFHPGNIMVTSEHRFVVIDFMNVCLGPALYDIARTYALLKEKDEVFGSAYLTMMAVSEEEIEPFYAVIKKCRRYEVSEQ